MPRSTWMPDTRDSDSATLRSGSLPMSSAATTSTNCAASRFLLRAVSRLARMPVISMRCDSIAGAAACCGAELAAAAEAAAATGVGAMGGELSCAIAGRTTPVVKTVDVSSPRMTCLGIFDPFLSPLWVDPSGAAPARVAGHTPPAIGRAPIPMRFVAGGWMCLLVAAVVYIKATSLLKQHGKSWHLPLRNPSIRTARLVVNQQSLFRYDTFIATLVMLL